MIYVMIYQLNQIIKILERSKNARNNENNWQIPKDIISFTKKNKKKIDEIGVYDIYGD